ncbi:MAG TPA: hypothetical protein VLJ76_10620 [Gaiellaceae bacterium]|nr:hypothetical protein [Gaiellaceae bacterium]
MDAARLQLLQGAVGAAGVAVLAVGLAWRYSPFLVWGLALLGADYALWLELGTHALDQRAPIVGGALLLTAELAFDSLEPEVGRPERTAVLGRAIALAIVVLVAVAAGAIVLAAASIPLSGGIALTAVGAAAVVAVLAVIARLAAERP